MYPPDRVPECVAINMTLLNKICLWVIALLISVCLFLSVARADTDGTEIQVTAQPEKLIIQLGPQWADVQFRLKTDEGLFPVPVVVDQSGILKMELGGSGTYTLSCFGSAVAAPQPEEPVMTPHAEPALASTGEPALTPAPIISPAVNGSESKHTQKKVSLGFLIIFAIGLIAAVIGLIEVWTHSNKRANRTDDDVDN